MFKGIILSVIASVTFGVLYFYTQLLTGLDSEQTFGWRMLATLPFLTLLMWLLGDLPHIKSIYQRVLANPAFFLLMILSSLLTSVQLWLFLWGPMNGRGLQVSLGYFLLPLVLVLSGSLFYGEKLSKFQIAAVILAVIGVSHEIFRLGSIAWETALVAFGYSAYFLLRKKMGTDNLGGFWWDIVIILPIAVYFIQSGTGSLAILQQQPFMWLVVLGLGLLSAVGLGSYILASRFLPMILFGLLSYLEPILLALASLALGEKISPQEWYTYIPIWCAVSLLVVEGSWHLYQQHKNKRALERNVAHYQKRLNEEI